MQVYISRGVQRFGPFNLSEVQARLDAGQILPTDLAWHEGLGGWREVWRIEGISFSKGCVPPAAAGTPARPAASPSQTVKSSGQGELVVLIALSIFVPLVGVAIGIVRLTHPDRRAGGLILLAISTALMGFYAVLLFLLVV